MTKIDRWVASAMYPRYLVTSYLLLSLPATHSQYFSSPQHACLMPYNFLSDAVKMERKKFDLLTYPYLSYSSLQDAEKKFNTGKALVTEREKEKS